MRLLNFVMCRSIMSIARNREVSVFVSFRAVLVCVFFLSLFVHLLLLLTNDTRNCLWILNKKHVNYSMLRELNGMLFLFHGNEIDMLHHFGLRQQSNKKKLFFQWECQFFKSNDNHFRIFPFNWVRSIDLGDLVRKPLSQLYLLSFHELRVIYDWKWIKIYILSHEEVFSLF